MPHAQPDSRKCRDDFSRKIASEAVHDCIERVQTDCADARPTDTTGAKTDSLRAVCLELAEQRAR